MNYRCLLLLAAVVGMVALAGCSTGGGDATTTTEDITTTSDAPATEDVTTTAEGTQSADYGGTTGSDSADSSDDESTEDGSSDGESAAGDSEREESSDGAADGESAEESGSTGDDTDESDDAGESGTENGTDDGAAGNESAGETDGDGRQSLDALSLTPVNASAENVTAAAQSAAGNVTQYRAVGNVSISTTSNNAEQTIRTDQVFRLNRTGERFRQSLTLTRRGITQESAAYLVNGTLYNRGQGNVRAFDSEWTKITPENVSTVFDRQDVLSTAGEYLDNATLSVAGGATLSGHAVYVVEADIDPEAYAETQGLASPAALNGTTVSDANATYYVDRNTSDVRRFTVAANWTSEFGGRSLNRSAEADLSFSYEPVSITLPEAAEGAFDIDDQFNTSTGNETDTNETDTGEDEDTSDDSDGESGGDDSTSDHSDETARDDETVETDGIRTDGGDLAVDADLSFGRIEHVLETNVTEPASVTVLDEPRRRIDPNATGLDDLFDWRTFDRTVGLDRAAPSSTTISMGAYDVPLRWVSEVRVGGYGNVYLRSLPEMPTSLVRLLTTHEFVHYVQLQNDWIATVNEQTDLTTDGRFAAGAMVEGGATYVTDSIIEAYDLPGPRNMRLYEGLAEVFPAGSRSAYGNRQYSEGARYLHARLDDPTALSSAYEDAPTTSEQVLHNLTPAAEPPVEMALAVETNGTYVESGTDRKGEAYTRHVLANGLDFDDASAAAAGWGNDSAITFRPAGEGNNSYVWVHRWDDADNATEFADAAREYLLQYGEYERGTTTLDDLPARLRRVGDRTTALVIGPESFQGNVTVSVEGSTVEVTAP